MRFGSLKRVLVVLTPYAEETVPFTEFRSQNKEGAFRIWDFLQEEKHFKLLSKEFT